MEIKLYNTLTNKKEIFTPITPGKVKIYTCGVTVYDHCHLGHARGAINFDVMRNVFEAAGYEVTYVKNYTDIDDKMINRSNERKISISELAKENIQSHDEDMLSLGVNPPDLAPKATDYIPQIISITRELVEKGFAYEVKGSVFFRVRKFEKYGKLSGKNIDDLQSGIRVEVDENKEDALDFALWKAQKPNEPSWDSPWGPGRPGWHIECSAMSKHHLGESFDIHAGGSDLIFPHHENEIAQSECANGKPYANYWLHNGMIKIEKQKMSKSLGNFATIRDLVKQYEPELIRFFTLSTQYRQSIDFSHTALLKSAEGLDRIYGALERYASNVTEEQERIAREHGKVLQADYDQFLEAMADDLNSPQAIAVLFDLTKRLNTLEPVSSDATNVYYTLLKLGEMLGILRIPAVQWFKTPRIKINGSTKKLSDEEIETLLKERRQARADKNWELADQIRDQLQAASIHLEDRDETTVWRRK
ncbi:cysteine--tRNA ligase [bacterium]|nr:cysteine--tRNA ligase [bacterium]